jgi:hypothetical protein
MEDSTGTLNCANREKYAPSVRERETEAGKARSGATIIRA